MIWKLEAVACGTTSRVSVSRASVSLSGRGQTPLRVLGWTSHSEAAVAAAPRLLTSGPGELTLLSTHLLPREVAVAAPGSSGAHGARCCRSLFVLLLLGAGEPRIASEPSFESNDLLENLAQESVGAAVGSQPGQIGSERDDVPWSPVQKWHLPMRTEAGAGLVNTPLKKGAAVVAGPETLRGSFPSLNDLGPPFSHPADFFFFLIAPVAFSCARVDTHKRTPWPR